MGKQTEAQKARPRWHGMDIRRLALVMVVCSLLVLVGGVWLLISSGEEKVNGKQLARAIDLPERHSCGKDTTRLRVVGPANDSPVFALPDSAHWTRRCLDDLLAVSLAAPRDHAIQDFIDRQVLFVLARRPMRFYRSGDTERFRLKNVQNKDGTIAVERFDRLVQANKNSVAHNAMAQANLGTWLLNAAEAWAERDMQHERRVQYEALGLAALNVILDPLNEDGLNSSGACKDRPAETCSWYHAVTRRTGGGSGDGGTLNKHLIVISRLAEAADALAGLDALDGGRTVAADRFSEAARAGLNQLVYAEGHVAAGRAPNLSDYIPRDAAGEPIVRSFLYYGLNPARERKEGYFLKVNNFKNCHYHVVDMKALLDALKSAGSGADLSGFTEIRPDLKDSLIGFIIGSWDAKVSEGLFEDGETAPPGNWAACRRDMYSAASTEKIVSELAALGEVAR